MQPLALFAVLTSLVPAAVQDVQTILVTPGRRPTAEVDTPFMAEVVPGEEILDRFYRTTPQALRNVPGVMVQETAFGQGSPYLRGFTGYRNLFLIDGIRLNNSVFRDGPNQYWNTVDPLSLAALEVTMGPGSVLYGSDAIGGTVQALSKDPWAWDEDDGFGVKLYYRASSAEESHTGRLETSFVTGDTGVLAGVTGRHFGDVQGGEDIGTQPNTGYDELDGDLKVEHFLDANTRLVIAHQQVDQDDVPRTHRTMFAVPFEGTTVGSDRRRELDQRRSLSYVQLHAEELNGFVDAFRASLSWHEQEEERFRIRDDGRRDRQGFDVGTLGVLAQFESQTEAGRWTWGVDAYHDTVDSFLVNLEDPDDPANMIQGPVADDAAYDLVGVYVQDEIEATERLTLTLGTRFEYAAVDANEVRDPVTDTPISVEDDWSALVGSARFVYALTPRDAERRWNLFGGVSQAFRAPNLSDLTRFDTARTDEFEIPSTDLDPEHYVSFELGVKHEADDLSFRGASYYTDIEDQIVRFPTGDTNAEGDAEITKDNAGDGYVFGLEAEAAYRFAPEWTVFGGSAWLDGEVSTFPTSAPVLVDEPIDRQMPWTTHAGVRWDAPENDWWAELLVVHAADADELSTRDAGDTSRIPPGGTPGYTVGNVHAGWRASSRVELFLGVDNVTDEDYRVHGSGTNMPGRNFLFGMQATL